MLRATGRLIRADLAQRPLQAALTGLVVAIAAAALLVTLAPARSARRRRSTTSCARPTART